MYEEFITLRPKNQFILNTFFEIIMVRQFSSLSLSIRNHPEDIYSLTSADFYSLMDAQRIGLLPRNS